MSIEARNLSKWYGQVIGVNNLNFTIGPGVTGFLGPNGAGKTTMIRLLTGQLKPSKGDAVIDSGPVWNNHHINRRIGYCPEADAFWSYLTGTAFVESLMRIHGLTASEARDRALNAITLTGMEGARDKRIGGYSKGMRQRIKLAQAIAHDPDILFLDEPLNGMDPIGRKTAIDLIKQLGNEGKTVVVSSHILHEVEEMTDTILLINHGRLLAQGNIYEIRALIDKHPLQVTISCSDVSRLTARLMDFDDIQSIQFDRDRSQLTVETTSPEEFHRRLPGLVLQNNIKIQSMWSPDENLEAVFDYLVR
ncbi:ABC transporter ATP-binding protein [bacterium]|nr:ABC transporter ATP-binding protein [bacterium]